MQTHFDASAADDFWKHSDERRNCSKRAFSPFATMFSTHFDNCPVIYRYVPVCLPRCFQSRLLQICCMWKRVNPFPYLANLQQTTLTHPQTTFLGNIVGKDELANNEQFILLPNCFFKSIFKMIILIIFCIGEITKSSAADLLNVGKGFINKRGTQYKRHN